jgi:DUF4097 and DUF4098 domain-containing protein YvlB
LLRVWVEKRFPFLAVTGNGVLYFDVPSSVELEIKSSSGSIAVDSMDTGHVIAAASSGEVELRDIRARVDVSSSSGNIRVDDIRGDLDAEASSGDIEIDQVRGSVVTETSSGSSKLSRVDGDISVSATSGRIDFEDTKGMISAQTSSGGIDGKGVWIDGDSSFHSTSGNIDIEFGNPLGAFSFRLSSTSGKLQAGDVQGEKDLAAGTGFFKISGETSSGNQRYR